MRNFIEEPQRLKIKIEAQNKNLLITHRIIFKFYNMERVETLCNLLSEKLQKKAVIAELLTTVKMIESELLHLQKITPFFAVFHSINYKVFPPVPYCKI